MTTEKSDDGGEAPGPLAFVDAFYRIELALLDRVLRKAGEWSASGQKPKSAGTPPVATGSPSQRRISHARR